MFIVTEEVFGSNKALWFSPNGNKLAFGYFDDSNTPIMTIPFYGYPGSLTFQYTSSIPIHYPKVSIKVNINLIYHCSPLFSLYMIEKYFSDIVVLFCRFRIHVEYHYHFYSFIGKLFVVFKMMQ